MNIITMTSNLEQDRKTAYNMTNGAAVHRMREAKGQVLEISGIVIYEDTNTSTGEISHVVSIRCVEGDTYATNSKSFVRDFEAMVEFLGVDNIKSIKVMELQSRNGRGYLRAELA